jgi:methylenetetrahydrofolate reductase (NADPH)
MKIAAGLSAGNKACSFEFFPPKTDAGVESLIETVRTLRPLAPLFVSVTYGAAGSSRERTIAVAKRIKRELDVEVLVHVTCVGSTVDELRRLFDELAAAGIENVLALRGDAPEGQQTFTRADGGLEYATELVALLAKEYQFCIGAACYPEGHIEASSAFDDLKHLREKVDAGAQFLITQLFFDNSAYLDFVARTRAAGITVPIIPGIMPITDYGQVARFTKMCGASIPAALRAELEYRADDKQSTVDLGVAYATLQCSDLLVQGAPALHFYTLNRSPATRAIVSALLSADRMTRSAAVSQT